MPITYEWRGGFSNGEVNELHAAAFGHRVLGDDWWGQLQEHSLGWVCARDDDALVGFVNVAWDGGVHAFVLDTMVAEAPVGKASARSSCVARWRAHAPRTASGSTSTSRTTCGRSTSTRAASRRRTQA